jgi:UDP-N-acetylglucosamine--N-acetylmuramyl-(pentapeptide) pyrophosphoryl-undecaprenol N-acetylglucosamine transferase
LIFTRVGNYTIWMNSSKTYIFAGGGTGGHLFPGIAVAEELKRRDDSARFVFVGSPRALETQILDDHGFAHEPLRSEPLPTLKRNPVRFFWRNWKALQQAKRLLNDLRPTAIIGLGGYASAPVVWAARRRRIPVILLEQNVIPGRTTRWLSRFVSAVCLPFEESRSLLPRVNEVFVTGNPVRIPIATIAQSDLSELPQMSHRTAKPELLILGGSQGADSLNEAVLGAVAKVREKLRGWELFHQSGPRQADCIRKSYMEFHLQATVEPFFSDMPRRYSNASLVISRAGATTLAELACGGIPMILLPFPHAMDDHQRANARLFADRNAAIVVEHASNFDSTVDALARVLSQLIDDLDRRKQMAIAARQLANRAAAQNVVNVIFEVIGLDDQSSQFA